MATKRIRVKKESAKVELETKPKKKRSPAQIAADADRTGRKTKIGDEELINALCDALKIGVPRDLACDYAGFSRTTFYKWLQQGEAELNVEGREPDMENPYVVFTNRVRAAEATQVHHDLTVIQQATEECEYLSDRADIALKRLERRHPKHFGKRVDLTSGDQPIKALVGIDPSEV